MYFKMSAAVVIGAIRVNIIQMHVFCCFYVLLFVDVNFLTVFGSFKLKFNIYQNLFSAVWYLPDLLTPLKTEYVCGHIV